MPRQPALLPRSTPAAAGVSSRGKAFGFHGLHLTTEAVAAFGELLVRGGRWGDQQLVPSEWIELATSRHIESVPLPGWAPNPDFASGYGYQIWMSRHGFHGNGAFFQQCVVVPSHELVIALTAAVVPTDALPGLFWDCLLPGLDNPGTAEDDDLLADRLRRLSFARVPGVPGRSVKASLDAPADSALPEGTTVILEPVDKGWRLQLGPVLTIEVGYGEWRESSPLGRPIVASGAWQGDTFVSELLVITTPHRVRLTIDANAGTATATWTTLPMTGLNLELHLRSPLMTRPDVA